MARLSALIYSNALHLLGHLPNGKHLCLVMEPLCTFPWVLGSQLSANKPSEAYRVLLGLA